MSFFQKLLETIQNIFRTFYWTNPFDMFTDVLDIVVVSFLFYQLIKMVRQTRAVLLLKGIVILIAAYTVSVYLNLTVINFIMTNLFQNSVLALVIIFQPELRRALEQTGRSKLSNINIFSTEDESDKEHKNVQKAIDAVCSLTVELKRQKMGALIVFERMTKLGEIVETGTLIDAYPSHMLLGNLFFNKAPLHDGAVILRGGKILSAGCILPLSENPKISLELGTRHRAALGMSEVSDSLVVVVSEETGSISIAVDGILTRNITKEQLRADLEEALLTEVKEKNKDKDKESIEKKSKKKKPSEKEADE